MDDAIRGVPLNYTFEDGKIYFQRGGAKFPVLQPAVDVDGNSPAQVWLNAVCSVLNSADIVHPHLEE